MMTLVPDLVSVGLTENEAKVYCCLLRKQHFTASEIARCAKVNRSKIYQVLAGLVSKGLCIEKLSKVRKYEAVDPEVAFTKLIEDQKSKITQLNNISDILIPIYKQKDHNSSPLDFIQVFSTPASIIRKHHNLELESKKFVLSFCKPPYAMTKDLDIHEEQMESMKKNKVIYKSIFEVEMDNMEYFARRMRNFELQGEEIKVAYSLPIKLHVFDESTVMFSMINTINPQEHLTYLVIEHPDLAETLINTFYQIWDQAISVKEFITKEGIKL